MYYVLFTHVYTNRKEEKSWEKLRSEPEVIEFLHKNYKLMTVREIIEVKANLRLGLIITGDFVKSELEPKEEEPESLVELTKKPEKILKENKKTLEELEEGEPSAMSKIAGDIEEEIKEDEVPAAGFAEEGLTEEEKTEELINKGDQLIERENKRAEQKKKGWALCIKCNKNRTAPHNKKGICTECQQSSKGKRPYTRSKEFAGL